MRKKTKWILSIVLVVCIGMIVGGIYLYNEILPKAKPIQLPETETVVSASLCYSTDDESIAMSEKQIETLFAQIGEATPTRIQAWNDTPTVRPYYSLEFQTQDRWYHYFFYEDNNRFYIESPYEGIYETNIELLNLVQQYCQED